MGPLLGGNGDRRQPPRRRRHRRHRVGGALAGRRLHARARHHQHAGHQPGAESARQVHASRRTSRPSPGLGKAWYMHRHGRTRPTRPRPSRSSSRASRRSRRRSPRPARARSRTSPRRCSCTASASRTRQHVPYKGSSQAMTDVAGGQVLFASDTVAAALPLIRGGKLRALAVTAPERLAHASRRADHQGARLSRPARARVAGADGARGHARARRRASSGRGGA